MKLFAGELVVLLGASGSGKSTLLNILGGLDSATGGTVDYRGWNLTGAGDRELTRFRRENVAIVTEIARDPMRPEDALALVGLEDRMDHFPSQLSGGEQQRVAIARAIAKRPAVLMCDEPTIALDSKTDVRVLEAIQHINEELGTTTAVITHNEVIGDIADRVIRLHDGRVSDVHVNAQRKAPRELHW